MIHISSADPDGLKGVNVEKMQKSGAARGMALKSYHDALDNKYQWCIMRCPPKMGQEGLSRGAHQRGGGKAVAGHFGDRARHRGQRPHGRVGSPRRQAEISLRKAQRPGFGLPPLPAPNGTDFTCWLIPGAQWHGGGDTLPDGTFFDPNMPTEEVFTSPMRGRCEGTLVSTLPLSYQGNLIDKFSITFANGRVVSCQAEQGQALLERMVAMDEGAAMLGELALVPVESPSPSRAFCITTPCLMKTPPAMWPWAAALMRLSPALKP